MKSHVAPKRSVACRGLLSDAPVVLKKCVLGPNGPRIKDKSIQEIVVNMLTRCRLLVVSGPVSFQECLPTEQVVILTKFK